MIKIVAKSVIKDGRVDEAIELYDKLIEETRKEPGCISYELFRDLKNPNTIAMVEEWEDVAATEYHNETPHFKQIVPKVKELSEERDMLFMERVK